MSKQIANGHCTTHGYSVEAREVLGDGRLLGDQVFTKEWKQVVFGEAPPGFGVPRGSGFNDHTLTEHGLMSYPAAQAMRWWFHATHYCRALGIETRLMRHKIVTDYTVTEEEPEDELPTGHISILGAESAMRAKVEAAPLRGGANKEETDGGC